MRAVSIHRQGGGFPVSQGTDIPHHGALGKTTIGGFLDDREGEGWGVPAGGHVPQYRPACLGSPLLEAPRGPPTSRGQFGGLRRQANGNGAGGHHQLYGGNRHKRTVGVRGDSSGGLDQPTTMADAVWGGDYGALADFQGIWGLDGQRSSTLGGLQGTGAGAPHWPRQVPWGVWPVGVGGTWRQMLVKCVMAVLGAEAK